MTDDTASSSVRAEEFPFSEWQLAVEDAADRLTGRVRQSARSAFVHLRKAWRLYGIDDEMSALRAITAEEEAATTVMMALKQRRYHGSDWLRPWNHVHKSAFWPLIVAINQFLVHSRMPTPRVALSRKGKPQVSLHIDLNALTGFDGEPKWAQPDQPLNFSVRSGDASAAVVHLFEEELAELASEAGDNSIRAYVGRQANTRNRLLYASDEGVPSVTFHDSMLRERARRVSVLIMIAIIVMQTTQRQLFVTQCLEALLNALDTVKDLVFDYSEAEETSELPRVTIHRTEDKPPSVSLSQPMKIGVRWGYAFDPST